MSFAISASRAHEAVAAPHPGTADAVLTFRTAPFGDLGLSPEARDWIYGKITPLPSQLAINSARSSMFISVTFSPPPPFSPTEREKSSSCRLRLFDRERQR